MVVGLIGLLQRIKASRTTHSGAIGSGAQSAFCGTRFGRRRDNYPAQPFAPLFQSEGAGLGHHRVPETRGPWTARNILVALDDLGADRIGHGVQAIHDEEVIARLVRDHIPSVCPWSDVLTQAFPL